MSFNKDENVISMIENFFKSGNESLDYSQYCLFWKRVIDESVRYDKDIKKSQKKE